MENASIMVVEDESIVAMEIQSRLKSFGHSVCAVVSSGEAALEKLQKVHPDLVLMDIVLKGDMDGIETAEQIKTHFDIPVVYLTAYADDATLKRAKITGPFGYVVKPFKEIELRTNIEIALYRHMTELTLKESKQWYAATLDSIGDAVIATDTDGIVQFINPFAEALTGWNKNDAVGMPLHDVFNVISKDASKQIEDPIMKIRREGSFFGLADDTLLVPNRKTNIPVDIIGTPIKNDQGDIIGNVIIFYDITDRMKAIKDRIEELGTIADYIESVGKVVKSKYTN